ncbi:MAG: T9SS type A sorting domain-containing protein [Bacteroidota bacterium]|jgi:hypothetical protein
MFSTLTKFLLLVSIFLVLNVRLGAQCMSGVYTVGGISPNFSSLTQAVNAIDLLGVCGPVELRLRNGTYPGGVAIPTISGVSVINTIRITSESGDSTQVIINCNLSVSPSAGIFVDTSSYVKIDHITFLVQSNSQYGSSAIMLRGNSTNLSVESCVFQQPSGGFCSYIEKPFLYADISGLRVKRNLFINGHHAINLFGPSSTNTNSSDFKIQENSFINFTNTALRIIGVSDIEVADNNFNSTVTLPGAVQLELAGVTGAVKIIENVSTSNSGGFSLGLDVMSPSVPAIIANNMISAGLPSGSSAAALGVVGLNHVRIYHNTLRSTSPASANSSGIATLVFNGFSYSNVEVRNNIIANSGGGMCFRSVFISYISTNNCWYTTGPDFASFNNFIYPTLQAYQIANSLEQNSLFSNPYFISPTDLHVQATALNSAGWAGTGILFDIDGQLRNSPPDIGADEIVPTANSVENSAIISPSFPTCLGNTNVIVKIKNLGLSNLQTCQFEWVVNNVVQPIYNWSGNLQFGDSSVVTIGTLNLLPQTAYTLTVKTKLPNGQPDPITIDDSLTVSIGNTFMSGTFIIGQPPSNFPTISFAVNALNTNGVCGPVTMLIKDGTYTENISFQNIPGASAVNTITFQSLSNDSSLVILNQPTTQLQIATLNNSKYIYFRALSFRVSHPSYPRAIVFSNTVGNIYIDRCAFKNVNGTSVSPNAQLVTTNPSNSGSRNNIFIDSCLFSGGYSGVELNLNSGNSNNISVSRSVFLNQHKYGVYMRFSENIHLERNFINLSQSTSSSPFGINLESITGDVQVIYNEVYTQSAPGTAFSIIGFGSVLPDTCLVYNNFFSGGKTAAFLSWSSNSMLFYFNNLRSFNSTDASLVASSPNTVSFTGWRILNNIAANYGTGPAFRQYNDAVFLQCNYNNYYSAGSTLIFGYGTLTSWRNQTGNDLNSQSGNPNYFSASNLHINLSAFPSNRGTPIAGIQTDIDGQLRSFNFPDIGADEYVGFALDAQMETLFPSNFICDSIVPVELTFSNAGSSTITSVVFNWSINNQIQPPVVWSGSLPAGVTSPVIVLDTLAQQLFSSYSIKVWFAQINSSTDMFQLNDTLSQNSLPVRMNGIYTVGGSNPDFSTINLAYSALETAGICGPVTLNLRNGIYKENVIIDSIPGSSSINRITLQSESGDSSLVILENDTASYYIDPIITINSSSNLVFRKVTFRLDFYPTTVNSPTSSPTRPGDLLIIVEKSKNIEVNSCHFIDHQYRSNFSYPLHQAPVSVLTNWHTPKNLRFYNNYFEAGGVALYLAGDSLVIKGNRFEDQFLHGVYVVSNCRVIEIRENIFLGRRNTPLFSAIAGAGPLDFRNITISKNQFDFVNVAGFININSNFQTAGRCYVTNNYFNTDSISSGLLGGIEIQIDSIFFCYNTVKINAGAQRTALLCRNLFNTGFIREQNNCIVNKTGGIVVDVSTGQQKLLNNNVYFTTGSILGNYNGILCSSMSAWVATSSGQDALSRNILPLFQVQNPALPGDTLLNDDASPLSFVNEDLFGNLRSSTQPDIGAVEFTPYLYDAGISEINNQALACDGNHQIEVKIINYSTLTLNNLQLHYSINQSSPQVFNWSGSLGTGQSTGYISIGSFFSINGTASVKVWTSMPNMQSDQNNLNDTMLNDRNVGPMSGKYTVGSVTSDFSLIADAVSALLQRGVCGPVSIQIDGGSYYESINISTPIPGVSQTDSVLFCSASGIADVFIIRNIQSGNVNHSVYIGSDYVSLRHITIDAALHDYNTLPTFYSAAVSIAGNYTSIDSCILRGTVYPQSIYPQRIALAMSGINLSITNNQIVNFHKGISINPVLTQPTALARLRIENNNVQGFTVINHLDELLMQGNNFSSGFSGQYYATPSIIDGNRFNNCLLLLDGSFNDSVIVRNNFFNNGTDLSGDYVLLANNTFNIHTPPQNFSSACRNMLTNSKLVNNIFHSENSNQMRFENNSGSNSSDYNVYWNRGNQTAGLQYLTSLQTTYPGFDIHSAAIDPMLVSTFDLHIQNPLLSGVGLAIPNLLYDIDRDLRNSAPCIGADEFGYPLQLIWPGNTNNDSIVDNFDLLPIGVYNGINGAQRWSVSINWQGYTGLNWGTLQSNGEDIKHVDCNGDGIITSLDTNAVSVNYGLLDLQPIAPVFFQNTNRNAAPVYVVFPQQQAIAGSTVIAEIWAGTSSLPFQNVYGIGMRLSPASSGIIEPGSESILFTNSWLCQPQITGWEITRSYPGGRFEGSIVRFDHYGRSGFGKIAEVSFRIDLLLSQPDTLSLLFERIDIIDSAGNLIPWSTVQSSLPVIPLTTGLQDTIRTISTYPNPANNQVAISVETTNEQFELLAYDSHGKRVFSEMFQSSNGLIHIDVSRWAEGMYFFRMRTDSGKIYTTRISVLHQ